LECNSVAGTAHKHCSCSPCIHLQLTFDTAQDYSSIDFPGRFEYKAEQRVAVAFDWASHSRLMAYGFVPCVQVGEAAGVNSK
jgi:hypothetical protein